MGKNSKNIHDDLDIDADFEDDEYEEEDIFDGIKDDEQSESHSEESLLIQKSKAGKGDKDLKGSVKKPMSKSQKILIAVMFFCLLIVIFVWLAMTMFSPEPANFTQMQPSPQVKAATQVQSQPDLPPAPVDSFEMGETSSPAVVENIFAPNTQGVIDAEKVDEVVANTVKGLAKQMQEISERLDRMQTESTMIDHDRLVATVTSEVMEYIDNELKQAVDALSTQTASQRSAPAASAKKKPAPKPDPTPKPKPVSKIKNWKILGLSTDRAVIQTDDGEQVLVSAGAIVNDVTIQKIDVASEQVITSEGVLK